MLLSRPQPTDGTPCSLLQLGSSRHHHHGLNLYIYFTSTRSHSSHTNPNHTISYSSGLGTTFIHSCQSLFFFLHGPHTHPNRVSALMGTDARVDNDYPRPTNGNGLECVVCHYPVVYVASSHLISHQSGPSLAPQMRVCCLGLRMERS